MKPSELKLGPKRRCGYSGPWGRGVFVGGVRVGGIQETEAGTGTYFWYAFGINTCGHRSFTSWAEAKRDMAANAPQPTGA